MKIKSNKKIILALVPLVMFIFTGCGPKYYTENQIKGRGINSGFVFDVVDNDRYIIHNIQKNNIDFFRYRRSWGIDKMIDILTEEKKYDKNGYVDTVKPKIITNTPKSSLMDVAKDRKNEKN